MTVNTKMLLKDKNVLRVVVFLAIVNLLGYVMVKDFNAVIFFVIVGFLATYYSKNMIVVALIAMVATNVMVVAKRKSYEGFASEAEIKTASADAAKAAVAVVVASKLSGASNSDTKAKAKTDAKSKAKASGISEEEAEAVSEAVAEAAINGATEEEAAVAAQALVASIAQKKQPEPIAEQPAVELESEPELNNPGAQSGFTNQYTSYGNLDKKIDHSSLASVDEDTDKLVKRQKELLDQYEKLQPALERSYKLLNSMGGANGVQGMIEKVGGMIDKFGGLSANINKK